MDQMSSGVKRHRLDAQRDGQLCAEEVTEMFRDPEVVEAALEGKAQIERGESVRLTLNELRMEIEGTGDKPRP